jgi:hypothetical protein
MPADGDVHVIEGAIAHHEALGGTTFLGGAAIVAHAALEAVGGQVVLHRRGGQQGGGAEQVVAAAMAGAASLDGPVLRHAGFLGEARQGVVLAEDGDDGAFIAGFAHYGRRDAGDAGGDAEASAASISPWAAAERCSA